jgi:hypothetical protein
MSWTLPKINFSIVSHDLRSSVNALKWVTENYRKVNFAELDTQLHNNSANAYNLLDTHSIGFANQTILF